MAGRSSPPTDLTTEPIALMQPMPAPRRRRVSQGPPSPAPLPTRIAKATPRKTPSGTRARVAPALADPRPGADMGRGASLLWIEIIRLGLLTAFVGATLLIIRPGLIHTTMLHIFGWLAYAVPLLLTATGLGYLQRQATRSIGINIEEASGGALLFVTAEMLLSLAGLPAGVVGSSLTSDAMRSLDRSGTIVVMLAMAACGSVLAFHWTTEQILHALWVAIKRSAHIAHWLGTRGVRGGRGIYRWQRARAIASSSPLPQETTIVSLEEHRQLVAASTSPTTRQEIPPTMGRVVPLRRARKSPSAPVAPPLVASEPLPNSNGDLDAIAMSISQDEEREDVSESAAASVPPSPEWPYPALDLLEKATAVPTAPTDHRARGHIIEETLASFNVKTTVVGWHTGPSVTQFDLQPERGVRVSRITALQNDLALALAASSIRIEAPVPGRAVVGIQIPNPTTSLVTLRETLESDACRRMKSPLKIALGQDVAGETVMADLARMPHLLIAGATGSGKSVCLNSLISCLIYHNDPTRLRLLMVDPKMVELTPFNGVPHLLAPVVTDVEQVPNTLKWTLREMKDRYTKFTALGVRNLVRYNEAQTDPSARLPYIVLIIDELADLMMVAPEDVESSICRLAQLARATGIHLVLATQRPSVDVITGLIKANFPARIAFAVSSQVDSRTILDMAGAEKLMGRGDMLYMPSDGSKPQRVQGTFLSDAEIERLVDFWKYSTPTHAVLPRINQSELAATPSSAVDTDGDDHMANEAERVVREYNRASVSLLQRRLSIGYSRAARILDLLETRGVVGPSEDGRSRVVLAPTTASSADEGDELPPF